MSGQEKSAPQKSASQKSERNRSSFKGSAPTRNAEDKPAHIPLPDFTSLIDDALRDLSKKPEESVLQGRIFDLRRALVERLLAAGEDEERPDSPEYQNRRDMLREALPPLMVEPGPYLPVFSAWRSAVLAILGLLAGSALGQGLLLMDSLPFGGMAVVFCGLLGVALALWLAEYLVQADSGGFLRLAAKEYRFTRVRRMFCWGFAALVVLTLVRDFLGARDALTDALNAFGAFLTRGDALALFSNMYWFLGATGLFALCLVRPKLLDRTAFGERLMLAARNWWAGGSLAGRVLAENSLLRRSDSTRVLRQVGGELYSLAGELPSAKREWMEERLRRLGLEAPRHEGLLVWSEELRDRYEVLGHLEEGESCYVDEPPLLEMGQLLRKGTVRKVRR